MAGELREAAEVLTRGAALADTISAREFAVYGEHPSMVCRIYGGKAKIIAGSLGSGAQFIEEAITIARCERCQSPCPALRRVLDDPGDRPHRDRRCSHRGDR